MKRLFVQTAWKGLLMSVLFYFLFVGNVDLRAQNAVSNGNFDATLINWTANPITGGWVWVIGGIGSNGAFASNIANNSTTGTLTQSLTNVAPNGAVLSFSLNWNYSSISGTASTFQISYNGVVYGQMITKSISTSSASITPLNGATGATVTVPVSTVTANNFATASFTLPNGIPTSGILEIKMISGSCFLCADDIGVDNVFLTSCTPGTPTATVTTEPTCATSTGSVTIGNLPATGNWTLQRGATTLTTSGSGTIYIDNTAAASTSYSYTVTNASGCVSAASNSVSINAQPATPVQPTITPLTQPTCLVSTGTFTISNYNALYTYTISPSAGVSRLLGVVTAPAGTYTVTATLGSCTSIASASHTLNAQITPAQPTLTAVTQPTCTVATGSFDISNYNAAYTYSITPSTGVSQSGATITAPAGIYTVNATLGSCISLGSALQTVNSQPVTPSQPTLSLLTQPTCLVSTGTFSITNYNALYSYTISPSAGVSRLLGVVTAPAGTYTVTATFGSCTSSTASETLSVPAALPQPTLAPLSQPTCLVSTGTFSITNYDVLYTYTISPSAGVSRLLGIVTAPAGTYTVTATLGSCSSAASASEIINAQPVTPAQPTLTAVTQPTCTVATGSFDISNYNAAYTYSITPSTGVSQSGATITAPAGIYTVNATLGSCISLGSALQTVNSQPVTPSQPTLASVTQPTCLVSTGTFAITNYNALYNYTITPSAGVSRLLGIVTAPVGTYTVTATLGSCTSEVSLEEVIQAQPVAPPTPTLVSLTEPTCLIPTGTFEISNYNVLYNYTISPSTGVSRLLGIVTAPVGTYTVTANFGDCVSEVSAEEVIEEQPLAPPTPTLVSLTKPTCLIPTGTFAISNYNVLYNYTISPSTGVSRLLGIVTAPVGTYTVTANFGDCVSEVSAEEVIEEQPLAPPTPTLVSLTQPTCLIPTGTFAISNYNVLYNYTISPSTGVSRLLGIVTAPVGTYTVTANFGDCVSEVSAEEVIEEQPLAPPTPTLVSLTQPTCLIPTGTFAISNYNVLYNYTISPSTGVSRLLGIVTAPVGTYTVTANFGDCVSEVSAEEVIEEQPLAPPTPTLVSLTEPTCLIPTGTFAISNYNVLYNYTISPSTGVSRLLGIVTAPVGTYTVTANFGDCVSEVSAEEVIEEQPLAPPTPTLVSLTQPTCLIPTGTFAISNYNVLYNYTISPSAGVSRLLGIVTVPVGTYTVTANFGDCVSEVSAEEVIEAQPVAPPTPTLVSLTQPTCLIPTGSFAISNYNVLYNYTISPSTGVSRMLGIVTAPVGTYTVTANFGDCVSEVSAEVVIDAQPAVPVRPVLVEGAQPTCLVNTGTFTISNYNAAYTYHVLPSSGVSISGETVAAPPGVYTVYATLGSCTSELSGTIILTIPSCTVSVAGGVNFTYTQPVTAGQVLTLNGIGGNPPAPYGIDLEDGVLGGSTTTSTLVITKLATNNAALSYDSGTGAELITLNQEVDNFNSSKITLKIPGAGQTETEFNYSFKDSDGLLGVNAVYQLSWTNALPVKLTKFDVEKGSPEGITALLKWTTATETNSEHFDIERSSDAKNWVLIGKKAAASDSKVLLNYNFSDISPLTGINYYRLKMVDNDGTFAYSQIRNITFDELAAEPVTLFPNPASNVFFLKDVDLKSVKEVAIINSYGLTEFKSTSILSGRIDADFLLDGIYIVKVTHKNGTTTKLKLVISK